MSLTQPLLGRRALVTGGSRGIGRAIAIDLARAGADVAINYRRAKDEADAVVSDITAFGRRCLAMAGDLSIASDVAAVADQTLSEFGDVDILVHNAGIASRGLAVRETTRDELERVMSVHALAPHDLTARLLPAMRKAERSDVIFISSAEVGAMHANGAPYNMGKSAMEALAFTLAKEEATHGVRVNIIAPGLVITDMGNRLVKSMTGEGSEQLDEQNLFPFRRACRPEDIATAVTAVLSPSFAYMTGQRIGIDGGVADINQVLRIQSPQH